MGPQKKWWRRVLPCAGAGFLLLTRFSLTTQAADTVDKPAKTQQFVTYKFGAAQWLNAPHSIEMSQGVTFGQDDATLRTDAAVALLDNAQNLLSAQAQGPVHIYDPQDDLNGQHGAIDFTKHQATLQDNIVLIVKPGKRENESSSGSLRRQFKDPATLTCQTMTYNYRSKIGRVPGPLTVRQIIQAKTGTVTRTLTADAGIYNGKAQTILLLGNVKAQDSDGNVIQAPTPSSDKPVVIGIKEGAEYIKVPFNLVGKFPLKSQEGDSADTEKSDAADADPTNLLPPTAPPVGAAKP